MHGLLKLSRGIDTLNESMGRLVIWLVLLASLVSAFNAVVRYLFGISSNALLEIQWYMFALIFLFAAGYTLKHDGHVRIDILYGRFSPRTRALIDIFGTLAFLLPVSLLILWLSLPMVAESIRIDEMSPDAGGLLRWPIKLAIPVGFALLALQGISEVIKRIAFLRGQGPLVQERTIEVA